MGGVPSIFENGKRPARWRRVDSIPEPVASDSSATGTPMSLLASRVIEEARAE